MHKQNYINTALLFYIESPFIKGRLIKKKI